MTPRPLAPRLLAHAASRGVGKISTFAAPVLVALAAVALTAPAVRAGSVPGRPSSASPARRPPPGRSLSASAQRPPPPPAPSLRVATSSFEVDVAALPAGKVPPTFTARPAPSTLPAPPEDVRLVTAAERSRVGRPELTSMRIESTRGAYLVAGPSPDPGSHQPSLTVGCGPKGRPRSFFWESLRREPAGTFTLTSSEGWLDPQGCQLTVATSSALSLAPLLVFEGRPLLLAARTDDGLFVVGPMLQQGVVDLLGSAVPSSLQRGLMSRLRMSVQRGGASVFSMTLVPGQLDAWLQGLGFPPLSVDRAVASLPWSLRLDLSQSIREPAPLALLTLRRPLGLEGSPEPAKPSPGAPRPGLDRTPIRSNTVF